MPAHSKHRLNPKHPGLHDCNAARAHTALDGKPPVFRLTKDNVLGDDI
jgi:hypothetical protein